MDTTPGPVPVYRALKNSPHQLITTTMSCPMSARQRACLQPCPGPPGNDDFLNSGNCEISTVSTTTAPGNNDVLNESNDEVSTVSSTSSPGINTTCKQGHRPPGKVLHKGVSKVFQTGKNHGNRPRHHDRDVDDQRRKATAAKARLSALSDQAPVVIHNLVRQDLHDQRNRDIDHRVYELGNLDGFRSNLDHGDQPLRKDGGVDDVR